MASVRTLALLALQGLALSACVPAEASHHHDVRETAPPSAEAGSHSLYLLDAAWTDQAGEKRRLADLAGRPVVVAMAYTHCTFSCPRIIAQMKAMEARLAEAGEHHVGFVLVSIDPERDTPERLASYAASLHMDPSHWTLLSGGPDDVQALSVMLGVKIQATGDGEFAHSNRLTLLDAQGVKRGQVDGLTADLAPAVETLLALPD